MDRNKLLDALLAQKASQKYQTNLDPIEQLNFANWASKNDVPVDLSSKSDYDMPGFFKNMQSGGDNSQPVINVNDGQLHFTDKFKTPEHETFSNESQYSTPDAPHWEGSSLRSPKGNLTGMELPNGNIIDLKKEALSRFLRR